MLRLDPSDWKKFQQVARAKDMMPAQLIRQVMRTYLISARDLVEKQGKKSK
jgi:hypothetical protein